MDIHITSTGTPGNAGQDIQRQLKALPPEVRNAWPATLAAIRDDVAKQLQQQGGDNVQADLHITFDVRSLDAADVIRAFNAGEPLPVPGESPTRRRSDASSATAAGPASTLGATSAAPKDVK